LQKRTCSAAGRNKSVLGWVKHRERTGDEVFSGRGISGDKEEKHFKTQKNSKSKTVNERGVRRKLWEGEARFSKLGRGKDVVTRDKAGKEGLGGTTYHHVWVMAKGGVEK